MIRIITYATQIAFILGVCYLLYSKASKITKKEEILVKDATEHIPEFSLETIDGQVFSNREFKNYSSYLIVYFNSECPDCIRELELIDKFHSKFINTHIVFVSEELPEDLLKVRQKYMVFTQENVDLLIDQNHVFGKLFNASSYPTMFIYNGEKQLIEKIDDPVGIKTLIKITRFASLGT